MDLRTLRKRVDDYTAKLNRASAWPGGVKLIAVTKNVAADVINMAYEAGVRDIGENRVQEWREKAPSLNPGFRLHMIGQLQTNKVKYIINHAALIHSLDRPALAREIDSRAQAAGRRLPVLVQVNIGREAQKAGVDESELPDFLAYVGAMPGLEVSGLMAILPEADDPEEVRPLMRRMRALFDDSRLRAIEGVTMRELSMGMSHDCMVAASEGATMIRIGTALFGPRRYEEVN